MISRLTEPLHHLLSTLHDSRYRLPRKTRFRLAGCAFAGRESNPLGHGERFQSVHVILLSRAYPVASWVHPRVGGGAIADLDHDIVFQGPSPRGRGSREQQHRRRGQLRSIPAWAGEPPSPGSTSSSCRVHPRVGGGASVAEAETQVNSGPSPRGRGSQSPKARQRSDRRSIPAWAGEPPSFRPRRAGDGVHPRVGGGARRVSIIASA